MEQQSNVPPAISRALDKMLAGTSRQPLHYSKYEEYTEKAKLLIAARCNMTHCIHGETDIEQIRLDIEALTLFEKMMSLYEKGYLSLDEINEMSQKYTKTELSE